MSHGWLVENSQAPSQIYDDFQSGRARARSVRHRRGGLVRILNTGRKLEAAFGE